MGRNNSTTSPPHKVNITKDFWMGETEVTQDQYQAIMKENPSEYKKGGNYPVERVSWNKAMEFCNKLTERERRAGRLPEGYVYTLPTEAQWEYAARGGNKSKGYEYSGSDNLDDVGWYHENSSRVKLDDSKFDYDALKNNGGMTHPVHCKSPNELGFYDMSGNVYEWCRDSCLSYSRDNCFIDVKTDTYRDGISDPFSASGSQRVLRGGDWVGYAFQTSVTYRYCSYPEFDFSTTGFRVALVPSN